MLLHWESTFYPFKFLTLICIGSNHGDQWGCFDTTSKTEIRMSGLPSNFVFKQSLETAVLIPHFVSTISPNTHFQTSIKPSPCKNTRKAQTLTRPTKIWTHLSLTGFLQELYHSRQYVFSLSLKKPSSLIYSLKKIFWVPIMSL